MRRKSQTQFQGLRTGNSAYTVLIDAFTANTYVMVVASNASPAAVSAAPTVEATLLNVAIARETFERTISEI